MRNSGWKWLVVLLLGATACAVILLFQVSVEGGAAFPHYSSLRAEPSGVKALHDALAKLDGYRVERSFKKLEMTRPVRDSALLLLGDHAADWQLMDQRTLEGLERRMVIGQRVVVSMEGRLAPPLFAEQKPKVDVLNKRWHLRLESASDKQGFRFVGDGSWTVLRKLKDEVVAVEKPFGAGSIVLLADSFVFTNEALRDKRDTAFLLRVLGGKKTVIFDEQHLGTEQHGSIGQLLRRYHLEAAALVLIVLALLFFWRSSSSFLPRRPADYVDHAATPPDALSNLVRRNVSASAAAGVSADLWNKSASLLTTISPARRALVAKELEQATEKNLLAVWRRAHEIVRKGHVT